MVSAVLLVLLRIWALPLVLLYAVWLFVSARKFVEKSAWGLTESLFLSCRGWLRSTVSVVRVNRMQVVGVHTTPFDRRTGMAQLRVDTAGSTVRVRYLADDTASTLARTLATATGRTSFRW
jgi:membrane protein YdbS with pleckstrin-like domain